MYVQFNTDYSPFASFQPLWSACGHSSQSWALQPSCDWQGSCTWFWKSDRKFWLIDVSSHDKSYWMDFTRATIKLAWGVIQTWKIWGSLWRSELVVVVESQNDWPTDILLWFIMASGRFDFCLWRWYGALLIWLLDTIPSSYVLEIQSTDSIMISAIVDKLLSTG